MKKQTTKAALLIAMFAAFLTVSCDDTQGAAGVNSERWIKFVKTTVSVEQGKTIRIVPSFSNDATKGLTWNWSSSETDIATVSGAQDRSAEVTALEVGTTVIRIECASDSALAAECTVTVAEKGDDTDPVDPNPDPEPVDDGVVRILAIGNSFSQDAVEQYLWNLADAAGHEVVIGNMYIGGCSLATHLTHANNDAGAYAYRKVVDGVRTERGSVKLSTAIVEEPWDYISLQQASDYSGVYSTFEASLPALVEYVEQWATNKDMQLMLHQTWAYSKDSGHVAFPTYGKDQMNMYNSIVDAYARGAGLVGIDIIIPAGTAIQNGRTSYLGDTFNRDGYHLKESYGRYTAACTWFEKIFGENVVGNDYVPASVLPTEAEIAQHAAHTAVLAPNEITELVDYRNPPADEVNDDILAYPVYIDFGKGSDSRITASPWNNITSVGIGGPIPLFDSRSTATGINIYITKAFGNINESGPGTTTTVLDMPSTASIDSFWGNTGAAFENKVTNECQLTVSSLNVEQDYTFTFFSGRSGATDNREAQFTVAGTDSDVLILNSSGNTTETVTTKAISPNGDGKITISITSGPDNDNSNGFFYLNALSIAPAPVQ